MDSERFSLSTSREPNPLRPYYIPPSVGQQTAPAAASTHPLHAARTSRPVPSSLSSSAHDLFVDIDIDIKSSTSEAWQQSRALLDTLVWRYTSVLLAQPFDVAKTILQVSLPPSNAATSSQRRRRLSPRWAHSNEPIDHQSSRGRQYADMTGDERPDEDDDDSENSDGVPDYFTATAPRSRSPRKRRRTPPTASLSPSPTPTPRSRRQPSPGNEQCLHLKRPDSIMHAISTLYNTSGAVGIWRASNCTFLYSILIRTTDSFVRSLLLAVLGLPEIIGPDVGGLGPSLSVTGAAGFSGLDVSESPNPLASLIVVGLASGISGLLLAPLDVVRTRLIVTPTSSPPRGLVQNLRQLPSVLAPADLWLPTALFHTIPQLFSAACPLVLRRQLRITPELTPSLWSLATFTASLTDLFLRLPLETVLRRAQTQAIRNTPSASESPPMIVDPAPYAGIGATVYSILYVEGETTTKDLKTGMLRTRRGQGPAGLVRGWRVGFWGLVGYWTIGAVSYGDGKGRGEF